MQPEMRYGHVIGVPREIQETKDLLQPLRMVCANPFGGSRIEKSPEALVLESSDHSSKA
jgi:hypothetical protein